jgi:hypothetical protein
MFTSRDSPIRWWHLVPKTPSREVTQSRQQQEILRDLLNDLQQVNGTVRRFTRDEGKLDLDRLERRIREVIEE